MLLVLQGATGNSVGQGPMYSGVMDHESSVLRCFTSAHFSFLDMGSLDLRPLSHLSLIVRTKNSFHLFGRDVIINCVMILKYVKDNM